MVITGLQSQPLRMLQRINVVPGLISERYLFDTFKECVSWLGEELRQSPEKGEVFFEELGKTSRLKIPVQYRL